ncbi:hypothetical protein [uncultured Porphyromonas sp.]|jgi:hypothetical protein|uniref:hypothetical protein n=1 Tax=uncultured Porphyromonas sp. TaxID=159274 RepID=UPI00260DDF59|nr:hypothetical protein [uncultured Porphyromonas sp.]
MMTTILLCVLLLLGIVWLALGIAYSYERWRSLSCQRISQRQEPRQREDEAHELVARSKGLTAHVIPPFPVSSVAEESKMNTPTFAEQSAEEEGEELDVDYTMEVIDEEEVLREELEWEADSGAELTSTSVLSRDLLRLSQWSQKDDLLDEEAPDTVSLSLRSLRGTDLLAQYQAELLRQEAVHKKLLLAIREAESETEEVAPLPPSQETRADMQGLDYYL